MKKLLYITYTALWILFLFVLARSVPANFGDLPADATSLSVSIAGQETNQTVALTALFPVDTIDGYTGVYLSRQVADNTVVSEVINARIQGGVQILGLGIEGFVDAARDQHRGIDRATQIGYFVRPIVAEVRGVSISGGVGNFTENRAIRADLDLKDTSPTQFGWLAFVSGRWKNIGAVLKFEPEIRFNEYQIEANASIAQPLSPEVEVGITTQAIFDSVPITDDKLHTTYMIYVKWGERK